MGKVLTLRDKEDIAYLIGALKQNEKGEHYFDEFAFDTIISGAKVLSYSLSYSSKDPNTKVGACVFSYGQAGFGVNTDSNYKDIPWDKREGSYFDTKYPYVTHAEINAISEYLKVSEVPIHQAIIVVTLFPCHECAKVISTLGIRYVLYMDDKYEGTPGNKIAKEILDANGVRYFKI